MKFSSAFAALGFLLLSCEKKETSPPADMQDPMEVTDKTSAAPMSSDTVTAADSSLRPGNAVSDTTNTAR
ncbi:hypothetical protein [Chryseobacterium hagamense]|uniref:hypothetical protein n=1 Tax=Chryseobacterium hagamense TaxID=395935 RepID=UPI0011BF60D9|nr:hypothetical protein [Chryseobacterium hagamense]